MPSTFEQSTETNIPPQEQARERAVDFVARSEGEPERLIDGRWMIREDLDDIFDKCARQFDIARHCLGAGDDGGAFRSMRLAASYMRHAAPLASALHAANLAAETHSKPKRQ